MKHNYIDRYISVIIIMYLVICKYTISNGETIDKCGFVVNNYFAAHFTIYPEYPIPYNRGCLMNAYCNKIPHSGMVSLVYDIVGIGNILNDHKINIYITYKNEPEKYLYSWSEVPVNGVIWKRVYLKPGSYISKINIFCDQGILTKLNQYGILLEDKNVNFVFPFIVDRENVLSWIKYKIMIITIITILICVIIGMIFRMVQKNTCK
ncbi:hypothetical protein [Methylacidiphilum kamchatkense]|nr:hypothetical protein [Methylacidiphilum kamchatkense]